MYYSIRFRSQIYVCKGTRINLHKGSKIIVDNGKLLIGCGFTLSFKTVLDVYNNGTLLINERAEICNGAKVMIGNNAILKIDNNSYINKNLRIQCRKEIEIGDEWAISWNLNILDRYEHRLVINSVKKQIQKR